MYIEFQLPNGAAGQAAAYSMRFISNQMKAWSQEYDIPYKTKQVKYTYRVIFDDPATYSFWALTWVPASMAASRWRLVDPMARPPK